MIQLVWKYAKEYKIPSLLSIIFIILEVVFEIQIPLLMSTIIDQGVSTKDLGIIYHQGGMMIFYAAISLVFGVLSGYYAAKAGIGFGANLRKGLFDKIQSFSFSNIDNFSTSSLITRLTTDVTGIQMAYMAVIRVLVRSPVMLILAAIMAVRINNELVEIFLISIPVLGGALFVLMRFAHPRFKFMLDRTDNLNKSVQENLTGIRVVKAFNRQSYESEKFKDANTQLMNALLRAQTLLISIFPIMMLVMNGTVLAVVWFGGRMIISGTFLTGELISFINYCTQILMSLMMIGQSIMMLTVAYTSLTRVQEVFNEPSDITDDNAQRSLEVKDGSVQFDNVYFKYNNEAQEYILDDINLKIESGETIGILGGTGSSKSSLVQLIPRLYNATSGKVLVGNHPVDKYEIETLRNAVGMVLQSNVLFSGTIADNLRWGNPRASDAQLIQACSDASIADFIESLPDGLNTNLGQGGVNLSGGQKQRLCIARALLKNPKIIILDDSTSAVDMETDRHIRESFRKNLKHMTTIIIAQRVASVEDSDKVIIMDDGKVVAFDTPENLAKSNKIYQEILNSQKTEMVQNPLEEDQEAEDNAIELAEIVEEMEDEPIIQEGVI